MIAGDPAAVEAAADAMERAAADMHDAADGIGSHGRAVTADWSGPASDAAGDAIAMVSVRAGVGASTMSGVPGVLRTFASELRTCQQEWAGHHSRRREVEVTLRDEAVAVATRYFQNTLTLNDVSRVFESIVVATEEHRSGAVEGLRGTWGSLEIINALRLDDPTPALDDEVEVRSLIREFIEHVPE